ncbi:MAG: protein-L-isoaspartate O-methyltransferase family protein, partial [Phycisphaerales bacterium]
MTTMAWRRRDMVERQLRARGIRDEQVLAAFLEVPRERFVPPRHHDLSYEDAPLPIEEGQTISQPYIVAFMLEAAKLGPASRVLEVGAGSGYATAVISRIAAHVHAIE